MLRSERTRPRPATVVADWRGALWTVLGHPPPRAALLVEAGRRWVLTEDVLQRARRHHEDDLALAPPIAPLLLDRADRLVEIAPPASSTARADLGNASWTAALTGWEERRAVSSASTRDAPDRASPASRGRVLLGPGAGPRHLDWTTLDRTLSGLWRGLRHAAGARVAADLQGAGGLVPLGGGVCAEITAHRCPNGEREDIIRAGFRTYVEVHGVADVFAPARRAHDGSIGASAGGRLPRGLWIRGAGIVVDVRLAQAHWL